MRLFDRAVAMLPATLVALLVCAATCTPDGGEAGAGATAGSGGAGGAGGQAGSSFVIDPTQPQDLLAPDGAGIAFGANSLQTADGADPVGLVTVELESMLSAASTVSDMPGGFAGIDELGEAVRLVSYGVIRVDLTDSLGQPLDLKAGAHATLTIPALAPAGPTVPLWSLDEPAALWHEEGEASLAGSSYRGEVSHLSLWNLDKACAGGCADLSLTDNCGAPLPNVVVTATAITSTCPGWTAGALSGDTGTTATDGTVRLDMPGATEYELSVTVDGETFTRTLSLPEEGTACVVDGPWAVESCDCCLDGACAGPPPDCPVCPSEFSHCAGAGGIGVTCASPGCPPGNYTCEQVSPSLIQCCLADHERCSAGTEICPPGTHCVASGCCPD